MCVYKYITWIASSVVGIPNVALDTLTPGSMCPHDTVRIGRTVARIHALLGPAGQHLGAVIVHGALGSPAALVGVSEVAGRADAARLVVANLADSFDTALFVGTGVLTLALDAGLRQGTFKVAVTTRCKE